MNTLLESIESGIDCKEWNSRIVKHTFVPWTSTYGSRSADILNRSEVSLRLFDRCAVPQLCEEFHKGSVDGRLPNSLPFGIAIVNLRLFAQDTTGRAGAASLVKTCGLRSISTTNVTACSSTSAPTKVLWAGDANLELLFRSVKLLCAASSVIASYPRSNSLLLEKCLGWKGICVEPGVREFAMLNKRGLRSCAAFNAAAADKDGHADFCKSQNLGVSPINSLPNVCNRCCGHTWGAGR